MKKPAWLTRLDPRWLSPADPTEGLDRWLLDCFGRVPHPTETAFVGSAAVASVGGGSATLTAAELALWLRSARRRALVAPRTGDKDGGEPSLGLTSSGKARLAHTAPLYAVFPTPVRAVLQRTAGRRAWRLAVEALRLEDPHWDDTPLPRDPRPLRAHAAPPADEALANLRKVKHIVVLMLENRSFDHMLGYLRLTGSSAVEGLTGGLNQSNEYDGVTYHPRHLRQTRFPKSQDPCHSINCVGHQLDNDNGGFVSNFAEVDPDHPELVMGYYSGEDLPVYDYLAHSFCICDAWHCAVAGSTWTNRAFALTGEPPPHENLKVDALFDMPSFVRHLKEEQWRWYSHDPGTLRVVDSQYRPSLDDPIQGVWRNNFRFFNRRTVSGFTQAAEELVVDETDGFLDDVREGGLSGLSWIDPNFIDLSILERNSNDDHPPSDVRAAQRLVLDTFRALAEGPHDQWLETVLLITYDEHGGFYDHIAPPAVPGKHPYDRLGVRVPAIVVSPWVEPRTVSHVEFEHASIIKTILLMLNPAALDQMPQRVQEANHLGYLLTSVEPNEPPDYSQVVAAIAAAGETHTRNVAHRSPLPIAEGAPPLAGFPAEMLKASQELRTTHKLPPGQP